MTSDSNASNSIPVLMIAGPTAVGKTALTVALAKAIEAEIISADSMQIYRQMSIGTAKPSAREMAGVPHHMIDIVDPREPFSVADYAARVHKLIEAIHTRGRRIVITGGTGLYFHSVLYQMNFSGRAVDNQIRQQLSTELQQLGSAALHQRLQQLDPLAAQDIHPNNGRRVIRALEIVLSGGRRADFSTEPQRCNRYDCTLYVLNRPRDTLYRRIDQRVDLMLDHGLLDEVRMLKAQGLTAADQSMRAIGYKEVLCHLSGEIDYVTMVNLLKRQSRRYAKRQLTWFRRYDFATWLSIDHRQSEQFVINYIIQQHADHLRSRLDTD